MSDIKSNNPHLTGGEKNLEKNQKRIKKTNPWLFPENPKNR